MNQTADSCICCDCDRVMRKAECFQVVASNFAGRPAMAESDGGILLLVLRVRTVLLFRHPHLHLTGSAIGIRVIRRGRHLERHGNHTVCGSFENPSPGRMKHGHSAQEVAVVF